MAAATATRFALHPATSDGYASLVRLISTLAEYEKLTRLVRTTPEALATMLFRPHPYCEAVLVEVDGRTMGFVLFFYNFSIFLCKPGLYLEDLFIEPEYHDLGIGRALLIHLAHLVQKRDCGRFKQSVLDWSVPSIAFCKAMGADILLEWRICCTTGDALAKLAATVMPAGLAASA